MKKYISYLFQWVHKVFPGKSLKKPSRELTALQRQLLDELFSASTSQDFDNAALKILMYLYLDGSGNTSFQELLKAFDRSAKTRKELRREWIMFLLTVISNIAIAYLL